MNFAQRFRGSSLAAIVILSVFVALPVYFNTKSGEIGVDHAPVGSVGRIIHTPAIKQHELPPSQRPRFQAKPLWHQAAAADVVLRETRIPDGEGEQRIIIAKRPGAPYPLVRAVESWKPGAGANLQLRRREEMVADHLLVTAGEGISAAEIIALAQRLGCEVRAHIGGHNRYLVSFPLDHHLTFEELRHQVHTAAEVRFAEPDHYHYWLETIPNDPRLGDLWGLLNEGQEDGLIGEDIDASKAWSITTGHRGVMVGVIDSGIEIDHEDLAANIWRNPYEFVSGVDESGTGYADDINGWNFSSNNNSVIDILGHGTHVAGTIGAVGNNSIGVTGVAWEVTLVPIAFSGGLALLTSVLVPAIEYSVTLGLPITNNSWGNFSYSESLRETIAAAGQAGQLFVAAAGNSNTDSDVEPVYPASYDLDTIISVAATNRHGDIADFSTYGANTVHVGAPGEDIHSTFLRDDYHVLSGTSMAAPHVAGTAALMLSVNPTLSPQELRRILMETGDPHGTVDGKQTTSGNRINADRAIRAAMGDATAMADVVNIQLHDDGSHDSLGNGNGAINPGEIIAFTGDLRTYGLEDSQGVQVWLEVVDGPMTVLSSVQEFSFIERNSTTPLAPMRVALDDDAVAPYKLQLALHISLDNGHDRHQTLIYPLFDQVRISGEVRRQDTGEPISGATLALGGPESTMLTTDSQGRYSYTTLAGEWIISASSPGLLTDTVEETISGDRVVDFVLGAPEMALTPDPMVIPLPVDGHRQRDLTFINHGNRTLVYQVSITDQAYGLRDSRNHEDLDWQWEDIRESGALVSFPSSGSLSPVLEIGFPMRLFNAQFNVLQIGSNGFVTLGDRRSLPSQQWTFNHVELPNFRGPPYMIAALWTNLTPHLNGSVHYLRQGTTFTVQFTEVPHANSEETSTFQIRLHADGRVGMLYHDIAPSFRDFYTVGMQQGQNIGFTHIYNEDRLTAQTRLQWIPRLLIGQPSGSIAAGSEQALPLDAQVIGLEPGDYSHHLRILSNDPSHEDFTVPVTLRVLAEPIRAISMEVLDTMLWKLRPHGDDSEQPYVLEDGWQRFDPLPSSQDYLIEALTGSSN